MLRAIMTVSAFLLAAAPAAASTYSATPSSPTNERIISRDIVWNCGTGACQGATDESRPAVICQSLARRAGKLDGFLGCCHAVPKINVTERLRDVRCPALVIVGEEDPGTPVDMARDIHAALPVAELAVLCRASHLSNVEQPGEFNRALGGFLDKVSGRTKL